MTARRMGAAATIAFIEQRPSSLIAEKDSRIVLVPFTEVADKPQPLDPSLIDLVYSLSI